MGAKNEVIMNQPQETAEPKKELPKEPIEEMPCWGDEIPSEYDGVLL